MNPILINLACVPDLDEEDMTYEPLRFVGCLADEDIAALRASADAIESALVDAQAEEEHRVAELAEAVSRAADAEAEAANLRLELAYVLSVAIARGEALGYYECDDGWRARLGVLRRRNLAALKEGDRNG